jgi:hypothetical protein
MEKEVLAFGQKEKIEQKYLHVLLRCPTRILYKDSQICSELTLFLVKNVKDTTNKPGDGDKQATGLS